MARSMFDALTDEEKRGTLANPGSASPLGSTLSMKTGAFLHPLLQAAKDKFPKDNPRGRWLGEMLLGDSPQRTGRVAEGIPDQYFHYNRGSGSNVSPEIVDLAAALPIASTLKLAKAAAVPAAMATSAGLLGRAVKGKNFAPTSTDDIGAALLGQSLQNTGKLDDAMVAYQGSPHKFDALDPSKIGTGEGGQMFGHGMYVAENPRVAKGYQKSTPYSEMRRKFLEEIPEFAEFDELMDLVDEGHFSPQQEKVLRALAADDFLGFDYPAQAISEAYSPNLRNFDPSPELVQAVKDSSYLYEIDVPDEDIAKMLDWDAPLSEQPESVKRVILDSPAAKQFEKQMNDAREAFGVDAAPDWMDDYTGQSFYQALTELEGGKQIQSTPWDVLQPRTTRHTAVSAAESASKHLDELGITGIKYFDQGSRAAGDGTRNMVLFDNLARRAKVLKRDGKTIDEPSVDEFIGKLLED